MRWMNPLGPDVKALSALAGSPLLKNLSIAILMLSESGQLTYLHDKWWANSCVDVDSTHTSESLQPRDLLGLFLLLGVGLSIGLLLALMELLSRAHNQSRDGKVGERECFLTPDLFSSLKLFLSVYIICQGSCAFLICCLGT